MTNVGGEKKKKEKKRKGDYLAWKRRLVVPVVDWW
jgi:hypothetical protein